MAGLAYYILAHTLVGLHGERSTIGSAIGKDFKGFISLVLYAAAVPLAFLNPWIAISLYIFVAGMWFVPDTRIEKRAR